MKIGAACPDRAAAQHAALGRAVTALGGQVEMLPFVHGAYDSVFAKDNAIYASIGDLTHALLGKPRFPERRIEQAARAAALERLGIAVHREPAELEGGDVIVVPGRCALLGHGFRSAPAAAAVLERFLALPVVPLALIDPALYHLDTALAVLADGTALVCDEAFAPASRRVLRETLDVIAISRDEAMRFALNLVELGDAVVTGTHSPEVRAHLARRGKRVVYVPLDEFHRAGGSAACLLAPVHAVQAAVITAPTTAIRSTAA